MNTFKQRLGERLIKTRPIRERIGPYAEYAITYNFQGKQYVLNAVVKTNGYDIDNWFPDVVLPRPLLPEYKGYTLNFPLYRLGHDFIDPTEPFVWVSEGIIQYYDEEVRDGDVYIGDIFSAEYHKDRSTCSRCDPNNPVIGEALLAKMKDCFKTGERLDLKEMRYMDIIDIKRTAFTAKELDTSIKPASNRFTQPTLADCWTARPTKRRRINQPSAASRRQEVKYKHQLDDATVIAAIIVSYL